MVISAECRDTLLKELHMGHPEISRCHIWCSKLDADIELYMRRCGMCQDSANMPQASALHPWECPGRPGFGVYMDYEGPIRASRFW